MSNPDESIDSLDELMPEFGNRSITNKWVFEECQAIVKTHLPYYSFFRMHPSVLIVRDPRDIAISSAKFYEGLTSSTEKMSIHDVVRDPAIGFEAFLKHYRGWQPHARRIVKYEDIKSQPNQELGEIARLFGIIRSEAEIDEAVQASSFDSMRKAQSSSPKLTGKFRDGHQFVRTGQTRQWDTLLSEDDLILYATLCRKYDFSLYESS